MIVSIPILDLSLKRLIAQHCLIVMIKKWEQYLHSVGQLDALLTDISKMSNCISSELM